MCDHRWEPVAGAKLKQRCWICKEVRQRWQDPARPPMRVRPTYAPPALRGSIPGFLGVPVYEIRRDSVTMTIDGVEEFTVELLDGDCPDLSDCEYYKATLREQFPLNEVPVGEGICSYGCRDEPACQVDEPAEGWAVCWRFTDVELPFELGTGAASASVKPES